MKKNILYTIIAGAGYSFFNYLRTTTASIIQGSAAVDQLQPSDAAYLKSTVIMNAGQGSSTFAFVVLLVLLVAIWYKPVKSLLTKAAVAAILIGLATPSYAYYDRLDKTEYVEIGMNQSAFLIPQVGDNKKGQGKFMSQDYLSENKVAMKRIQIPHVLMSQPGMFTDMFIPAAKLILVDRTPYTREWTNSTTRGTSNKQEGFNVESADSVEITTAITISASVSEEDAAKFLYTFGSKQKADAQLRPEDQFASVIYGRSLADVMDVNVRGKVMSVLAREFGKRSTIDCLHQKGDIINTVEKEVREAYAKVGITIEYVGFSESLTLDKSVQEAVDRVFIAQLDASAAESVSKTLAIKQVQADINIKTGIANAVQKWNGDISLPSFLVVSDGVVKTITDLFAPKPQPILLEQKKQ